MKMGKRFPIFIKVLSLCHFDDQPDGGEEKSLIVDKIFKNFSILQCIKDLSPSARDEKNQSPPNLLFL